ncbi:MAG: hypothetical protein IJM97_01415 [Clostridia bacterium]|nr:hypothetical protein [Clostridia bacterium]
MIPILRVRDENGNTTDIPAIKGDDGIGITKTEINSDGELVITYSDGRVENLGVITDKKIAAGTVISDNKFDNNFDESGYYDVTTNGAEVAASNYKRTSKYYEFGDAYGGNVYLVISALETTVAGANVVVLVYDESKNYVGNDQAAGNTVAKLSSGKFTTGKYFRVYKKNSFTGQVYVSVTQPGDVNSVDYTYEVSGDNETDEYAKPLKGKVIVNFGDSIFGKRRPPEDISTKLAELTGATIHNCGFGGCCMSTHTSEYYAPFSMHSLATAISTGTWDSQDNAIATGTDMPSYFSETLELLKNTDFNKVDIVTIAYGTNDWNFGMNIDNSENDKDLSTFAGALRYSIETLLTAYPHLKIFICSQTYRFFIDANNNFVDDSNTHSNTHGVKLTDFVAKTKAVAEEYCIPFIDNYNIGMNKYNRSIYFAAHDGTHPLTTGCHLIACNIANELF